MQISESLTGQAYRQIEDLILSNELKQGQVLSESALQERLNLGRTPIHEALLLLANNQLVTIIPRKGVMINVITLDTVNDIFTVRRMIEPPALAAGAQFLDRNWLEYYKHLFKDIYEGKKLQTLDEIVSYQKADLSFHIGLTSVLHNSYIDNLVNSYSSQLVRINVITTSKCFRALPAIADHVNIIDYLLTNDVSSAVDLLSTHLLNSHHDVLERFHMGVSID